MQWQSRDYVNLYSFLEQPSQTSAQQTPSKLRKHHNVNDDMNDPTVSVDEMLAVSESPSSVCPIDLPRETSSVVNDSSEWYLKQFSSVLILNLIKTLL